MPGIRVMARLAAGSPPRSIAKLHAILELTLVGVGMAHRTGTIIKVKDRGILQALIGYIFPGFTPERRPRFVAISAGSRDVAAG